jgi:hypothetical protein
MRPPDEESTTAFYKWRQKKAGIAKIPAQVHQQNINPAQAR